MTTLSGNRFAACVANEGYETSLQRNKIDAGIEDADAAADGDLHISDEIGEDSRYHSAWFISLDVPDTMQRSVVRATG